MYDISIPHILHGLKTLDALLARTVTHCDAKKIHHDAILQFRLFPDMFPFVHQVQLVTDFAKGCAARLAGLPVPSFADDEKSFAELHARVNKTIDFIQSVDPAKYIGAAERPVTVRVSRTEEKTMRGDLYFMKQVVPNFYFHLTTTYNILRHNGLELGKGDFLGRNL